jgi:hypothetical protein
MSIRIRVFDRVSVPVCSHEHRSVDDIIVTTDGRDGHRGSEEGVVLLLLPLSVVRAESGGGAQVSAEVDVCWCGGGEWGCSLR